MLVWKNAGCLHCVHQICQNVRLLNLWDQGPKKKNEHSICVAKPHALLSVLVCTLVNTAPLCHCLILHSDRIDRRSWRRSFTVSSASAHKADSGRSLKTDPCSATNTHKVFGSYSLMGVTCRACTVLAMSRRTKQPDVALSLSWLENKSLINNGKVFDSSAHSPVDFWTRLWR